MSRHTFFALVVLLGVFLTFTSGIHRKSFTRTLSRHFEKLEKQAAADGTDVELPEAQWFTQQLDHFNHQDNRTWQQRYYINDTFYNPDIPGPIFFQFGGEGPISPFYVTLLDYVLYAQKYGALLVALEHRFYGESAPLPDLSTANLQYLSSQQALADAAVFIKALQQQYNAPDAPIVTFGCSYPGNLAAWFREKYPTVTDMSIASSSPVLAVIDFFQYLDVVDQSLVYFTGQSCVDIISNATQQIETALLTTSGQQQIQQLFNTCTPLNNSADISNFMSSLMDYWMGTVQYNDENGNPVDINYLCSYLSAASNNGKDPLTGYAAISNLFNQGACLDIAYGDLVAFLQNTNQSAPSGSSRAWIYQTCTEFGYYQTTDSANQPFGNLVPLSTQLQLCTDVYGMQFQTALLINETNDYYGAKNLRNGPTNILFINGDIDPWHSLGITQSLGDTLPAILIDGTAHCANVLPPSPNDPPGLTQARIDTAATIGQWMAAL